MENKISKEEVEKIAKLARISLSESEKDDATTYMVDILEYVDILSDVNTDKVKPYAPEAVGLSELREDIAVDFKNRSGLITEEKFNSDDLMETKGVFSKNGN